MKKILLVATAILALAACNNKEVDNNASQKADSIYFNGNIYTMVDGNREVEAVAVKNGKIFATGTKDEIFALKDTDTILNDLEGNTLMPGFIDAHSHFGNAVHLAKFADLSSAPVGDVENISDIIEKLQALKEKFDIKDGEFIVGYGYDPDLLDEKRHPTKFDLDEFFPNNPVLLNHVSGHLGVANSAALEYFGVDETTADPAGGAYHRVEGSNEPNGVLYEYAFLNMALQLPKPDLNAVIEEDLPLAIEYYASNGVTTANDGFTDPGTIELLSKSAQEGKLYIDVIALPGSKGSTDVITELEYSKEYKNHLRFGGLKLVLDGSPQGKTAYFTESYNHSHDHGMANLTQDQVNELVKVAYENNVQVYAHTNGDGAVDMLLDAHAYAQETLGEKFDDRRTVAIHSQFVRKDQLNKYVEYGIVPSYFTNHAYFWGDVHIENLGQDRAEFLSPLVSSKELGLIYTNHTDYMVTPINQLFTVMTAVGRKTRSGLILGPSERADIWDAFKAITINAAYQYGEEDIKGSLEEGKYADFVILGDNPFEVEVDDIASIEVLETIKEGSSIYKK